MPSRHRHEWITNAGYISYKIGWELSELTPVETMRQSWKQENPTVMSDLATLVVIGSYSMS